MSTTEQEGIGQTTPCLIQSEATVLMAELQSLGHTKLLEAIEQVVKGQYVLALCSVRIVRQQIGACQDSWRLFERVRQLVLAAICPYEAETLKDS